MVVSVTEAAKYLKINTIKEAVLVVPDRGVGALLSVNQVTQRLTKLVKVIDDATKAADARVEKDRRAREEAARRALRAGRNQSHFMDEDGQPVGTQSWAGAGGPGGHGGGNGPGIITRVLEDLVGLEGLNLAKKGLGVLKFAGKRLPGPIALAVSGGMIAFEVYKGHAVDYLSAAAGGGSAGAMIGSIIPGVGTLIGGAVGVMVGIGGAAIWNSREAIATKWGEMKDVFGTQLANLKATTSKVMTEVGKAWDAGVAYVSTSVAAGWKNLHETVDKYGAKIEDWLIQQGSSLASWFDNIVQQLKNYASTFELRRIAEDWLRDLTAWVKRQFGIGGASAATIDAAGADMGHKLGGAMKGGAGTSPLVNKGAPPARIGPSPQTGGSGGGGELFAGKKPPAPQVSSSPAGANVGGNIGSGLGAVFGSTGANIGAWAGKKIGGGVGSAVDTFNSYTGRSESTPGGSTPQGPRSRVPRGSAMRLKVGPAALGVPVSGPVKGYTSTSAPYNAAAATAAMGITPRQYDAFKEGLTDIEGKRYDRMGGSGGQFAGRYQMGMLGNHTEVRETARRLGVPVPTQEEFLKNPALQEQFFENYTIDHYNTLMKNPKFAAMDKEQQLQMLGYAHNQGAGGANNYLNTGAVGADANRTPGTAYFKPIASHLEYADAADKADAANTPAPGAPPAGTATPAPSPTTTGVTTTSPAGGGTGGGKEMLLAVGTNDWGKDKQGVQTAVTAAINAAKAKGYNPVLVLPNKQVNGSSTAYEGAMAAANAAGISTEYPKSFANGNSGFHMTPADGREIMARHPGAIGAGDSNAYYVGGRAGGDNQTSFQGQGAGAIAGHIASSEALPNVSSPAAAAAPLPAAKLGSGPGQSPSGPAASNELIPGVMNGSLFPKPPTSSELVPGVPNGSLFPKPPTSSELVPGIANGSLFQPSGSKSTTSDQYGKSVPLTSPSSAAASSAFGDLDSSIKFGENPDHKAGMDASELQIRAGRIKALDDAQTQHTTVHEAKGYPEEEYPDHGFHHASPNGNNPSPSAISDKESMMRHIPSTSPQVALAVKGMSDNV